MLAYKAPATPREFPGKQCWEGTGNEACRQRLAVIKGPRLSELSYKARCSPHGVPEDSEGSRSRHLGL